MKCMTAVLRAVSEVSERLVRFLMEQKRIARENGVQDSGDEVGESVPAVPKVLMRLLERGSE